MIVVPLLLFLDWNTNLFSFLFKKIKVPARYKMPTILKYLYILTVFSLMFSSLMSNSFLFSLDLLEHSISFTPACHLTYPGIGLWVQRKEGVTGLSLSNRCHSPWLSLSCLQVWIMLAKCKCSGMPSLGFSLKKKKVWDLYIWLGKQEM